MPVYSLPEPLFPLAFRDARLYKSFARLPLYCALARAAQFHLFPKPAVNTARCDVPQCFAARYFSSDGETAAQEFEHRWQGMRYRLWKGIVLLNRCIDVSDERVLEKLHLWVDFLKVEPYFPWHFVTACALTADCDSVCYRSFRGGGLNYAVFRLVDSSIVEPFQPLDADRASGIKA